MKQEFGIKAFLTKIGIDCYACLSAKPGCLDMDRTARPIQYNGKAYMIKLHSNSIGTWVQYAERKAR